MSKTHIKTLFNPDYIGAYAIPQGEDLTVTIKRVVQQEITGQGGKKDDKPVVHLEKPHKPLILNATNRDAIIKLYGPFVEDWAGKQITLYASTTKAGNDTVECVRIRPTVTAPKPRPIAEDKLAKALDSIQGGKYTVAQLLKSYELTPEQLERLPKQIEGSTDAA